MATVTDTPVTDIPRARGAGGGAPRLSAYGLGAALVALGTLFYVLNGSLLLPLFALALAGTYVTDLRIPGTSSVRLILRVSLYTLVYLLNQQDEPRNTDYLVGPASFRALFGEVYAAEMVIQAWRRRSDAAYVELSTVFFSGLVFLTACNTFEDDVLWMVTPFYLTLVALSLRGYRARRREQRDAAGAPRPAAGRGRAAVTALRVALFAVPLALGLVGQQVVRQNRGFLNDLGNTNVRGRRWMQSLGMAAQPQLGSTFDLRGSPARVLRVTGLGEDDHLRGLAFSSYEEGGRWGPPVNVRQARPAAATLTLPRSQPGTPGPGVIASLRVTRLSDENPILFLPLTAASVEVEGGGSVEWAPDFGGPLRVRGRALQHYRSAVSSVPDFQGPLATPWPVAARGGNRDAFLERPKGETGARFAKIAREATRGAATPREKASAVVAYLISNHRYSLTTTVTPGEDPVLSFLEEKKDAHCEYFAAAAALLLRYEGVPTRYVTGYLAHERTPRGDVVVRQRDAHAWTEVWIDGTGWVTIDATPGDGRPDGSPEAIEPWRRWLEWVQDRFALFNESLSLLPPWVINAILAAFAFLPVGYLALRAYLARRRAALAGAGEAFVYSVPAPDYVALARRFEAAVSRATGGGAPFPPGATWEEHLSRLGEAGEGAATTATAATAAVPETLLGDARAFARAYDAARFGGADDDATRQALHALLEKIEKEVRKPTA